MRGEDFRIFLSQRSGNGRVINLASVPGKQLVNSPTASKPRILCVFLTKLPLVESNV